MGIPQEVLCCMNQTPAVLGLGDTGHCTPNLCPMEPGFMVRDEIFVVKQVRYCGMPKLSLRESRYPVIEQKLR